MFTISLLLAFVLTTPPATARNFSVYVDLNRADDIRTFPHLIEASWFRLEARLRQRAVPIVIRARTEDEVERKFSDLRLKDQDQIVSILFTGHGHCGRVGHIMLGTPLARQTFAALKGKMAVGARVAMNTCQFVPSEPSFAQKLAQHVVDEIGLINGKFFAFFGTPASIDLRPFWVHNEMNWPAAIFQTLTYLSPIAAGASYLSNHFYIGHGAAAVSALTLAFKFAEARFYATREIGFQFDVKRGRVTLPRVLDWLRIKKAIFARTCEARLG